MAYDMYYGVGMICHNFNGVCHIDVSSRANRRQMEYWEPASESTKLVNKAEARQALFCVVLFVLHILVEHQWNQNYATHKS